MVMIVPPASASTMTDGKRIASIQRARYPHDPAPGISVTGVRFTNPPGADLSRDNRSEDGSKRLAHLAQAPAHFDRRRVDAERFQRYSRRASDKPAEHDDVDAHDSDVEQDVESDRGGDAQQK